MKEQLEAIAKKAFEELAQSQDLKALDAVRVKYLGKKGELTAILKQMGKLSAEERPVIGQLANQVRGDIEEKLEQTKSELENKMLDLRLATETLDVTLPGKKNVIGKRHPLTVVLDELKEIVIGMGFEIAQGPEVELDYYNFEALNIPKDHPARDTQDTFYINDNVVLRTQTLPNPDPRYGKPEAANPHPGSGSCVPCRRGGCDPLPSVPSGRGSGGR